MTSLSKLTGGDLLCGQVRFGGGCDAVCVCVCVCVYMSAHPLE